MFKYNQTGSSVTDHANILRIEKTKQNKTERKIYYTSRGYFLVVGLWAIFAFVLLLGLFWFSYNDHVDLTTCESKKNLKKIRTKHKIKAEEADPLQGVKDKMRYKRLHLV